MFEKIKQHYPPWLELIPILLLLIAVYYTTSHYTQLPSRIPTHFGPSGNPDSWSTKGFWSVYLSLVIGAGVWLSLALTNYFLIIKPEDPGKYINLTKKQKEKLGPDGLEAIRHLTACAMILINFTTVALIVALQDGTINTALGTQKGLSYAVDILAGALIFEALWLTIKTLSMTLPPKER
ncbi:MAG TPA: DUF1648 domain-containing protein [Syntrophomonadaceae bacterium]|nr:DUF1648 domain-containing protein [Syntrophomonadaceae bacterium]